MNVWFYSQRGVDLASAYLVNHNLPFPVFSVYVFPSPALCHTKSSQTLSALAHVIDLAQKYPFFRPQGEFSPGPRHGGRKAAMG